MKTMKNAQTTINLGIMTEPKPYSLDERNAMRVRRQMGKPVTIDPLRFEATLEQVRLEAIRQIALVRSKLPPL